MHVTNDGATILKSIGLDNPAAKILVGTSQRNQPKSLRLALLCTTHDRRPHADIVPSACPRSSPLHSCFLPISLITYARFHRTLTEISKVQDDEVGDGTTSVTVLAAELLREAEKLIAAKIHPQTAIAGYRMVRSAHQRAKCARMTILLSP
jgi:hypothetical protein